MVELRRTESNYSRWDGTDDAVDEHGVSVDVIPGGAASGENNAERTSTRHLTAFVDVGSTPSGDSAYAGVAVLKGRDQLSGIDLEVLTVSGQIGGQNEVQIGQARIAQSTGSGRSAISGEVFTARAGVGTRNADGSFGLNAGATAVAVGVEGTLALGSASSLTAGASWGVGAEGSFGLRDIDRDREPEVCVRAVAAWWTLGACVEVPWQGRDLGLNRD